MVWRRLLWPALMSLVMLASSLGLGAWQLQRLAWKRHLLEQIAQGESAMPTALADDPLAFRKVWVEGRFISPFARYGVEVRGGPAGPVMGAQVVGALIRQGMDPVIVDAGWAPLDFTSWPPSGVVRVVGYVRLPEYPIWMGAHDNPAGRQFYALDPVAIGASLGLTKVAPFTVVALSDAQVTPQPQNMLPRPPNDHLSYAITWFALAFAVLVVFGIYARQVLQEEAGP